MCDRVVITPEPEPGGELQPETDTGSGDMRQFTVVDDIGITQQSQSKTLPEIHFDFDAYGQLIVRDPGFSDQRGAGLSHTQERQGLITCTVPIPGGGDIMFMEEASSSHVSQQQPVVREPTLSDRDKREPETVTPGPVSGAGPEESDTDSAPSLPPISPLGPPPILLHVPLWRPPFKSTFITCYPLQVLLQVYLQVPLHVPLHFPF